MTIRYDGDNADNKIKATNVLPYSETVVMYGYGGHDELVGAFLHDNQLFGGAGNDTLRGGANTNLLNGSAGNDTLDCWQGGFSRLYGGSGRDSLTGGDEGNYLDGGSGADALRGGEGADSYVVDSVRDVVIEAYVPYFDNDPDPADLVLTSVSWALGTNLEDLRLSGSKAINATGNTLANTLTGNAGNNVIDGRGGIDTVSYEPATAGVKVSLGTARAQNTGWGLDTLLNVENLIGGAGADRLTGSAGKNQLWGGDGADTLTGGAAADVLTGGLGRDIFTLTSIVGADRITDFTTAVDRLRISQASIPIGDGDRVVDGALVSAAAGGFDTDTELVIFTANITGSISATKAAATIGSATSKYAAGDKALFAVDNGKSSAVYEFISSGTDALVSAGELTLLATLVGTPSTDVGDFFFGA